MKPETLSDAAFWDNLICLDCETVLTPDDVIVQVENRCSSCGSADVFSAVFVQRVIAWSKQD